jgi:hypothetical protein
VVEIGNNDQNVKTIDNRALSGCGSVQRRGRGPGVERARVSVICKEEEREARDTSPVREASATGNGMVAESLTETAQARGWRGAVHEWNGKGVMQGSSSVYIGQRREGKRRPPGAMAFNGHERRRLIAELK